MDELITLTADDEYPTCMNCDLCIICDGSNCGAEYGWWKYSRTEIGVTDE